MHCFQKTVTEIGEPVETLIKWPQDEFKSQVLSKPSLFGQAENELCSYFNCTQNTRVIQFDSAGSLELKWVNKALMMHYAISEGNYLDLLIQYVSFERWKWNYAYVLNFTLFQPITRNMKKKQANPWFSSLNMPCWSRSRWCAFSPISGSRKLLYVSLRELWVGPLPIRSQRQDVRNNSHF